VSRDLVQSLMELLNHVLLVLLKRMILVLRQIVVLHSGSAFSCVCSLGVVVSYFVLLIHMQTRKMEISSSGARLKNSENLFG
jgi:hypothetical protein